MVNQYEIRAYYDKESIVVYQAYSERIAKPALEAQYFVAPFSLNRMTWIKPSFLWLMHRSNWAQKSGQEYILAIRISRLGWEDALASAILTSPEKPVFQDYNEWQKQFKEAKVHLQWDPERSLRGKALNYNSVQVGLSRFIIGQFVDEWILGIEDYTPVVKKIYKLLHSGHVNKAKELLPKERVYPIEPKIGRRILMTS